MKKNAVLLEENDDVATLVSEVEEGDKVKISGAGKEIELQAKENIKFGHKVALRDIAKGEKVKKYGEIIGKTIQPVRKGKHVHTHNLESLRMGGED